jgi:hypothetical protein
MERQRAGQAVSPKVRAQIRELLDRGLGKRAIARRLGVSEMTIYRCLTEGPEGRSGDGRGVATGGTGRDRVRRGRQPTRRAAASARRRAEAARLLASDGYPEALLRRVPRDYLAMLPDAHFRALVRAAERTPSPAAARSLRQALLLHGEPRIAPPTSIELELSGAEEAEWQEFQRRTFNAGR